MTPELRNASRLLLAGLVLCFSLGALAQTPPAVQEPAIGTPGKDVVYVPQPAEVVERMMEIGQVTAKDFVIDLGSGDGRNVLAAARRGARALGVEFNPEFVAYSQQAAAKAGLADRAKFVQGDMFEADISEASVLALFLLTDNMNKLVPKFLGMKPGSRIVSNTFRITGWDPDETVRADETCTLWCEFHLYIIPAQAAGTWRLADGELKLEQKFQMLSGTLTRNGKALPVEGARLRGDAITFTAGGVRYQGTVSGERMQGSAAGGAQWSASRTGAAR